MMMTTLAFLLALMLLSPAPQTDAKPVIDNDRVTVWDVTSAGPQPQDAVVISFAGKAAFVPAGTPPTIGDRSIVIDLKGGPAAPIHNGSGSPLAFPRPGAKKLFENDRVIVWDYGWKLNVPGTMHFHDKDVVVLFLENGDLKSTTPDGKEVVTSYTRGTVKFNARNRTHFETLIRGKQHAIITELK